METFILDEKSLNRIPSVFVFVLVLILGLPIIAINFFGTDFGASHLALGFDNSDLNFFQGQIRGYFRQAILQWSAFSLSAITVLLAFTQYRLTNDKIALVIGLSILFSGSVEALHTVVIDGFSPAFIDKDNLDAVIWTFANTVSGLILAIGIIMILQFEFNKLLSLSTFRLISVLLVLIAFSLIYYAALITQLPTMWFPGFTLSRPYELIYLFIYLFIALFLYPKVYKKFPNILTNSIFYIATTHVIIACYMMLLSNSPYDSAFNIAYFLKIISYFIPFVCLIINYVFSYNAVLEAQIRLQISREKLKYLASHDPLTELYNRREFERLIDQKIASSCREEEIFALFIIDIDNFKQINDTYGHISGDEFIQRFADWLQSLTRKGEILSRIGGDEFTLITGKLKSRDDANVLADRLIASLNQQAILKLDGEKNAQTTVSLGIAIYPDDGNTSQELFRKADLAMYAAKNSGKNTYRFYSEIIA